MGEAAGAAMTDSQYHDLIKAEQAAAAEWSADQSNEAKFQKWNDLYEQKKIALHERQSRKGNK
jgi:hypothetical protein